MEIIYVAFAPLLWLNNAKTNGDIKFMPHTNLKTYKILSFVERTQQIVAYSNLRCFLTYKRIRNSVGSAINCNWFTLKQWLVAGLYYTRVDLNQLFQFFTIFIFFPTIFYSLITALIIFLLINRQWNDW